MSGKTLQGRVKSRPPSATPKLTRQAQLQRRLNLYTRWAVFASNLTYARQLGFSGVLAQAHPPNLSQPPPSAGISRDVPLVSGTSDGEYLRRLRSELALALDEFPCDLIVYNAGTDCLRGDPLGRLRLSPEVHEI